MPPTAARPLNPPRPCLEGVSEHPLRLPELRCGEGEARVLVLPHLLQLQSSGGAGGGAGVPAGGAAAACSLGGTAMTPALPASPCCPAGLTFLMCCRISSSSAWAFLSLGSARFSNSLCTSPGSADQCAAVSPVTVFQDRGCCGRPQQTGAGHAAAPAWRGPPPQTCCRCRTPCWLDSVDRYWELSREVQRSGRRAQGGCRFVRQSLLRVQHGQLAARSPREVARKLSLLEVSGIYSAHDAV